MRNLRTQLAFALTLLSPAAALAFAPHDGLVRRAPDTRVVMPATWTTPASARPAFDRLVAATGEWRGVWDRDTGVPVRLAGSGIAAPGAVRDPALAEAAARRVIEAHLDLLAPGAAVADLELIGNTVFDDMRSVTFAQRWNGIRVAGATIVARFKRDRLFLLGSSALPHVAATLPRTATPPSTLAARRWVQAETGTAVVERGAGDLVVYPRISTAGVATYTVARPIDLDAATGFGKWTVWIDAATGEPLVRVSRYLAADGTLTYNTAERNSAGPRLDLPAAFAAIQIDGAAFTTDHHGLLSWATTAAAQVTTALTGPYATIIDTHPLATATLPVDVGGTVGWGDAASEVTDAQITTFVHANVAKQHVRHMMDPFVPWVDSQLTLSVNEGGSCNAFAEIDPDLTHFLSFGGGCENTGRMPDVVYHEAGHNFHFRSLVSTGTIPADRNVFFSTGDVLSLSEGLSDTLSTMITNDPAVGPGFFVGDPNGLRNLDPPGVEKFYPTDITGESHADGEIIGGAVWDMRKALIASLGDARGKAATNRAFRGVMAYSTLFTETYMDAIAADDDDGNLLNGTPNQCDISKAFALHGLAPSAAGSVRVGSPGVDGSTVSVTITPAAADCPGPTVTGVTATWQVRGTQAPATLPLTAAGDTWSAALAGVPDGSVVQYQLAIALSDGTTLTRPYNAADPFYEAFVGTATELFCDDFETDKGWTHSATAGTDEWERDAGGIAPAAGDPDAAFSGNSVFGTDLSGNGLYAADTTSTAETPAVDTSGYGTVRLQYRRWLDVRDGAEDQAAIRAGGMELWHNTAGSTPTEHRDREWRFHDVDLTPAAASGSVQVQFALTSGAADHRGGWTMDDVCVVAYGATCGDTLVRGTEQCDDGNVEDGDGCSALCATEPEEEGGGCCSTGTDPRGALAVTALGMLGLLGVLRRRRRK